MSAGYRAVQWSAGKRRYDLAVVGVLGLWIAGFLGASSAVRPEITAETALIRAFGTAALLLLHVVLAIGPAARLDPRFLPLLWNRRHLGVTIFLCALAHGAFALVQFHALGDRNPLVSLLTSNTRFDSVAHFPFQQLGLAALVILFLMAATSHDFWLAQLTAPVWKALHMGVYLAYALVVAHVALGVLQDERHPLLASLLAAGVVALAALHLAAAAKERRIDRERREANADGFVDAGPVASILEKRARIVNLAGERVAIFRYDGKVSAISNVCQHQNGPLGEGRILDGCVTCPWHGYQYRPEDGASPAPFTEKVPTFRVRVLDGNVFVDPRPLPPGTPVTPARFEPTTVTSDAAPAREHRAPFFVGYLPIPAELRSFLKKSVAGVATVALAAAVAVGASQSPLGEGEFEYGKQSSIEGVLRAEPIAALWRPNGDPATASTSPVEVIPLVGLGKRGPSSELLSLSGKSLQLKGTRIRRGASRLFEVESAKVLAPAVPADAETATVALGEQTLRGEVVDSKCFLGVMKPGEGKAHRDCAVRCISGGAPAALVARTATGETFVLMLVSKSGKPLGPELLDRVAEPVEVTGEVVRLGNLPLLVTDPKRVKRLAPN